MNLSKYRYRVFVSYAEQDRLAATKIVAHLRSLDLDPMWDQDNGPGWDFVKAIKERVAHSHIFLPLLTPNSMQSTWVNHEIGFAVGRNVPLLPLSLGPMPSGMAHALHAEVANSVEELLPKLTRERINGLVSRNPAIEVYEFADHPDTRTSAIVKHCRELSAAALPRNERLRHCAAFGSFSLPADPTDPAWSRRYAGEPWRTTLATRLDALSEERRLLEAHAEAFGCDLVLYPFLPDLDPVAVDTRIEILRAFLAARHRESTQVRVRFDPSALGGNLLLVGDWFCAQSITPRTDGFHHTTITAHAPTVLDRIIRFDRTFERGTWMSADAAIAWLDQHPASVLAQIHAPAR